MPGFYRDSLGRVIGPISSAELKKLAGTNVITRDTMIAPKQEGPWINAGRVRGLFASLDEASGPAVTGDTQNSVVSRTGAHTIRNMSQPEAPQPDKSTKAFSQLFDKLLPPSMSSFRRALLVGTAAVLPGILVGGAIVLALTSSRSQAVTPAQPRATALSNPAAPSTKPSSSKLDGSRNKPHEEPDPDGTNSIETLTVEQAGELAEPSRPLRLNGLKKLTEEVAEALAKHQSELHLNGLTTISAGAATALAKRSGGDLYLNGLTQLSPEVAQALGKHGNAALYLNGLTTISAAVAKELAKHFPGGVFLNGLTHLTPEVAQALATHDADLGLHLDGLTTLTPEAARELVMHRGGLSLNGLQKLSPEAAEALGGYCGGLELNGLTTLSDETAKVMPKSHFCLYLNGLSTLSAEQARALAQCPGGLFLDGLTRLSDDAAKALGTKQDDTLSLDGLKELSNEAIKALAQHDGPLSLNGLASLSNEAANSLSIHTDTLYLNGLTTLSDEAAKALAKHKDWVNLEGLVTLSDEACAALQASRRAEIPLQLAVRQVREERRVGQSEPADPTASRPPSPTSVFSGFPQYRRLLEHDLGGKVSGAELMQAIHVTEAAARESEMTDEELVRMAENTLESARRQGLNPRVALNALKNAVSMYKSMYKSGAFK